MKKETTTHDTRTTMTPESRIYIYATEMVADYYSRIDLIGKSVLTIIGSGDQILNAYFFGARRVTGFDINRRSPYFVDLKIQAVKQLGYEQFLSFFGNESAMGTLDHTVYLGLRSNLRTESQDFFDLVYANTGGANPLQSEYFRDRTFINSNIKQINGYLRDEASFHKMKEIIKTIEPEFIIGDISELVSKFEPEKFDVINISNIPNYFVGRDITRTTNLLSVLTVLARAVKKGGIIFFYSYNLAIYNEELTLPPASRPETIEQIQNLGLFKISKISFTGTNGKYDDWINILEKI